MRLALAWLRPHYCHMRAEPQAAGYRPDPVIASPVHGNVAQWLGEAVSPADFPQTIVRFRNDRHAATIGLESLTGDQWSRHFGRFQPLDENLPQPLALKYHGHQFRTYNPEIGDGRGFVFAQMRDAADRIMDLGTKGSGRTPFSRTADGRLTLKGAVRELLATEFLEALGVNTSKTFSIIETGEELERGDEPSPARSAVLVRLSHGHIRMGTFQRLLFLDEKDHLEQLVSYCLQQYPGNAPPPDAPARDEPAVILMHQLVERMADMAASYMVAGFVHGVLNTDNMNVSGESFDYGPWRFLPQWDPGFTAAYFDQTGLYSFGRQPEAMHWNCAQFAATMRLLADSDPLIFALNRFGPLYMEAVGRRWCWRMGVEPRGAEEDAKLVGASEGAMREHGTQPDMFFFKHRGGGGEADGELGEILANYRSVCEGHEYWSSGAPHSMLIDEVETLWSAIEQRDDWAPLFEKVDALREIGRAHGEPLPPAGNIAQT